MAVRRRHRDSDCCGGLYFSASASSVSCHFGDCHRDFLGLHPVRCAADHQRRRDQLHFCNACSVSGCLQYICQPAVLAGHLRRQSRLISFWLSAPTKKTKTTMDSICAVCGNMLTTPTNNNKKPPTNTNKTTTHTRNKRQHDT